MSEAQTDEGLADFDYLSGAGLKSTILVNPSSVSSFLADSFPPRGKLKDALPEGLEKAC